MCFFNTDTNIEIIFYFTIFENKEYCIMKTEKICYTKGVSFEKEIGYLTCKTLHPSFHRKTNKEI
ncbi:hypothetical protein D0T60_13005 [Bacteroides sp. 224]|nr:hypothetical protein [Bacteroides sp. 224]